jgi:hypothetical protein
MDVKLTGITGTRMFQAWWIGTQRELLHPVCGDACPQTDPYRTCVWLHENWHKRHTAYDTVACVQLDDVVYRFWERPQSTPFWPGQLHRARSTMLGTVERTDTMPAVIHGRPQCGFSLEPALMVEVRVWSDSDSEWLYATDEATGKCVFFIGTELGEIDCEFNCQVSPTGSLDPKWLWPVDPEPPVEIIRKAKEQLKQWRKERGE